jgi:hypothetical protein
MKVSAEAVRSIVTKSLEDAAILGPTKPKIQSAKFVEGIGKRLAEAFCDLSDKRSFQTVNKEGTGKIKGEWLLDVAIWQPFDEKDEGYPNSPAQFLKKLRWAVESETNTSLVEMASDFNKLLAVHSDHYLYLNGMTQKTDAARSEYRERRLATARRVLKKTSRQKQLTHFYYGFWPSPEWIRGHSLWEQDVATLTAMVRVARLA